MIGAVLDRVIGVFSPLSQLRRMQVRKVIKRNYSGAEPNRLTANKNPKNRSADQEMLGPFGADSMRAWARMIVRDNAYAWSAATSIVASVVGSGITAQSILEDSKGNDIETVNDARDKLFSEWCEVCEINGQYTFSELQAIVQREIVEAGEVLVRIIHTPKKEHRGISRPVPLALELIEADRLSGENDNFPSRRSTKNENRISRGVELDELGKPVAYWIYPDHPNGNYLGRRVAERIPASEIMHLFRRERVGQTRGISWFAPVLPWVRDLGTYLDNELQASAVAACFTVAIKSDTPVGSLLAPEGDSDGNDTDGNAYEYLQPGMIMRLGTNESIESANPGRPNAASDPWISLMLRGVAAGTGTSYEAVSKDFSKTSYSSSRTSKLEDNERVVQWQQYLINHLAQPVWDAVCDAAAISGSKDFPTSAELLDDRRGVAPVAWQTPKRPWVDPNNEQQAAESAIKSFTSDYQTEMGAKGLSWRSVFYQRFKEEKLRKTLGLFTPEEQTQQMMAAQTANNQPKAGIPAASGIDPASVDGTNDQAPPIPPGAMMGLSTLQWNRNAKAILKTIKQLASGEITAVQAQVFLRAVEMPQTEIDLLIADAADGTVETPIPEEAVLSE